jgi:hypothetical protein
VDVRGARQPRRIDLHHRAHEDELPFGTGGGDAGEQLHVHALVDDAEEAEARPWQSRLIRRLLGGLACAREVGDIHAGRKRVDVRVQRALGLVQAVAARGDEVGAPHQLCLQRAKRRGRAREAGQLIHAVVHGGDRAQVIRERQRHRRVVPEDEVADGVVVQHAVDERRLRGDAGGLVVGLREVRYHDMDAGMGLRHLETRGAGAEMRFFNEENASLARKARHQVLRALEDEVPSQVRQAYEVRKPGCVFFQF